MSVNQYGTVTEALADLTRRGFTANFEYINDAFTAVDSGRTFRAEELTIVEHHRFEGASDPEDMAVVYAIESRDGIRGVVVDAFGVYANPKLGRFLRKVRILESPS
jgi:hypothetical protein